MLHNDIHLYFSYPEQISDPALLHRYESLLSADERARMARFHFSQNRHQYLVTRALVRTSLSAYYPVDPAAWQFDTNRYGKPEISHPDTALPVRFNLSHTQGPERVRHHARFRHWRGRGKPAKINAKWL